ncbi:MAG: hypothetical protein JKY61_04735 [Planctomycetes bacterium]|nr:hypothetical protein [Planctomycetota bacterium]
MGYTYHNIIERTARHLLDLLRERDRVPYSLFYDGTDETHDRLEKILEYDCPEVAMDLAVVQLVEQGLIETETLDSMLADENQDYEIRLTAKGTAWLAEPFDLQFHTAE